MSMNQQPQQENTKGLEPFLLLFGLVVAWPALLLGAITRWQIKQRTTEPYSFWIGAGVLGAPGALLLATHANPYPFLLAVLQDLVPLAFHMSGATFTHFLGDALPLWARSLLVFPWCTLLLELFGTRSLKATLLAQERQRRASKARKSKRAARKAAKAPDQINGQGVLGALIDDPNE